MTRFEFELLKFGILLVCLALVWTIPWLREKPDEDAEQSETPDVGNDAATRDTQTRLVELAESISTEYFDAGDRTSLRSELRGLLGEHAILELDACVADSHWESEACRKYILGLSKRIDERTLRHFQELSPTALRITGAKTSLQILRDKIPIPLESDGSLKPLFDAIEANDTDLFGKKQTNWKSETKAGVRGILKKEIADTFDGIVSRNNPELSAKEYLSGLAVSLKASDLRD